MMVVGAGGLGWGVFVKLIEGVPTARAAGSPPSSHFSNVNSAVSVFVCVCALCTHPCYKQLLRAEQSVNEGLYSWGLSE